VGTLRTIMWPRAYPQLNDSPIKTYGVPIGGEENFLRENRFMVMGEIWFRDEAPISGPSLTPQMKPGRRPDFLILRLWDACEPKGFRKSSLNAKHRTSSPVECTGLGRGSKHRKIQGTAPAHWPYTTGSI
jgi:hypothetical protein